MPRDSQPVRPGAVLTGLVHQALANIKDDSGNHGSHPTASFAGIRSVHVRQTTAPTLDGICHPALKAAGEVVLPEPEVVVPEP